VSPTAQQKEGGGKELTTDDGTCLIISSFTFIQRVGIAGGERKKILTSRFFSSEEFARGKKGKGERELASECWLTESVV